MHRDISDDSPTLVELREVASWPRYVLVGALVALAAASLVGHWMVIRQACMTGAYCLQVADKECPTCPGCASCPPPQVFIDHRAVTRSLCLPASPSLKPEDF